MLEIYFKKSVSRLYEKLSEYDQAAAAYTEFINETERLGVILYEHNSFAMPSLMYNKNNIPTTNTCNPFRCVPFISLENIMAT